MIEYVHTFGTVLSHHPQKGAEREVAREATYTSSELDGHYWSLQSLLVPGQKIKYSLK